MSDDANDANPRATKKRRVDPQDEAVSSAASSIATTTSSSGGGALERAAQARRDGWNSWHEDRRRREREAEAKRKKRQEAGERAIAPSLLVHPNTATDPSSPHCCEFRLACLDVILANVEFELETKQRRKRSLAEESVMQFTDDDEKREMFGWYGTSQFSSPLGNDLDFVRVPTLRKLYAKFCSSKKFKYSKEALLSELVEYFYRGKLREAQREEEKQVLATLDTENLFFRLRLIDAAGRTKEHMLTKDLMREILSFLKYNWSLITTLGLVSWNWFTAILTTWSKVVVSKRNLQSVPVTILRSISSIVFSDGGSKTRLTAKEVTYLLETVNPRRVRKVTFSRQTFVSFPRLVTPLCKFNRGSRKFPGPRLAALQELTIEKGPIFSLDSLNRAKPKQMEKFLSVRLSTFAPNATIVSGSPMFSWVVGMTKLRVLRIGIGHDVNTINFNTLIFPSLRHFALAFLKWRKPPRGMKVVRYNRSAPWVAGLLKSGKLRVFELQNAKPGFWKRLVEELAGAVLSGVERMMLHLETGGWGVPDLTATIPNASLLMCFGMKMRSQLSLALSALGSVKKLALFGSDEQQKMDDDVFCSSIADILRARIPKVIIELPQRVKSASSNYCYSCPTQALVIDGDRVDLRGFLQPGPSLLAASLTSAQLPNYDIVRVRRSSAPIIASLPTEIRECLARQGTVVEYSEALWLTSRSEIDEKADVASSKWVESLGPHKRVDLYWSSDPWCL